MLYVKVIVAVRCVYQPLIKGQKDSYSDDGWERYQDLKKYFSEEAYLNNLFCL